MPLFLDVHSLDDPVSLDDVTELTTPTSAPKNHTASATCATGWTRRRARSSASSTPRRPPMRRTVHREAHGLVAQEIYQVTEGGALT